MSTDTKFILVDGKYLLNADHVQSVGSMHTVQELSSKSQAPSGATDLTRVSYSESSYIGSSDVSMYETAGSIKLNMAGREVMSTISEYSSTKGVKTAITEEKVMFSWVNK